MMGGRWEGGTSNCFSHIDYWINKEAADTWQTRVTNYYHKKMILSQNCKNTLLTVSSLEMPLSGKYPSEILDREHSPNSQLAPLLQDLDKHILVRCGGWDTVNHRDRKQSSSAVINRHMSIPVLW